MSRLPYFPFGNEFDLRMGTVAFKPADQLVEVGNDYLHELELKRKLLGTDHRYYYRSAKDTELAQWDVVEMVLSDLAKFQPESFQFDRNDKECYWLNRKTDENIIFTWGEAKSLPYEPLDWVGRQVQEDLMILSSDGSASLVAGQLCFANGYALDDRYGKSFLMIHDPAPKMVGPTIQTAQKLMERLPVNRPVWRASWNFKISSELDQSTRHSEHYMKELTKTAPELNDKNIGSRIFIRIERQTFTRLPVSNCILFGIHTYQNILEDEAADGERASNMLNVLRTTPREMLNYKAIAPFETALLNYLESRSIIKS
jgi:hypothetical protein